MPAANQRVAAGRGLPPAAVETRPDGRGGITTMSQADGHDGLSRNGGAPGVEQRPRLVARVRRVHPGRLAAARIAPARAGVARCGAWCRG